MRCVERYPAICSIRTSLLELNPQVLKSANRVLHSKWLFLSLLISLIYDAYATDDDIDRSPIIMDSPRRPSVPKDSPPQTPESILPQNIPGSTMPVPPRREYVWRTIDRGQQSLATIASRISQDISMELSFVNKLTWTDGQSAHRCAGYVRQEITLATTTRDSAVISHDAPSPLEICSVCHDVVSFQERFQCICGDLSMCRLIMCRGFATIKSLDPGSRPTVKCRTCKHWSHSDCVGNLRDFTCHFCTFTAPENPHEEGNFRRIPQDASSRSAVPLDPQPRGTALHLFNARFPSDLCASRSCPSGGHATISLRDESGRCACAREFSPTPHSCPRCRAHSARL
jgi:hypothetical protein